MVRRAVAPVCGGAKRVPTVPMRALAEQDVTVVVATRDRAERLARCLLELRRGNPRSPVIVCDDASRGAGTSEVVGRHDGVRLVTLARNAGAAARNAGVREARTPLVAFCDDDAWWAPGALATAAARFAADPGLGLLAAHVLVGAEQRPDPVAALLAASPLGWRSSGPEILGFVACAAVVRRSAFLATGGFRRRYGIGGEEQPLAIDLARDGWALAYADDVVAHHHPERTRPSAERAVRVARNDLWTAWRRRSAGTAWRSTAALARDALHDPVARRALIGALRGLPWAVADRRAPGRSLERRLRAVDRGRPAARPAGA